MSVGCPEPEPPRSLPCCGPGAAPGLGAGMPLLTEDMQALTLRTLAASDVTKHYELVRELGKGTYGKVDLVAYKGTGEHLQVAGLKAGLGTCREAVGVLFRGQEVSGETELVVQVERGSLGGPERPETGPEAQTGLWAALGPGCAPLGQPRA